MHARVARVGQGTGDQGLWHECAWRGQTWNKSEVEKQPNPRKSHLDTKISLSDLPVLRLHALGLIDPW